MLIRSALFRGRPEPGPEHRFTPFVRDRLVPLRARFPGAEEARVPFEADGLPPSTGRVAA